MGGTLLRPSVTCEGREREGRRARRGTGSKGMVQCTCIMVARKHGQEDID